jgi:hypothetical protein
MMTVQTSIDGPVTPEPSSPSTPSDSTTRWDDISALISNRRWVRRSYPFAHAAAQNVFEPDFYAELHQDFQRIERDQPEVFQRNMTGYDASGAEVVRHRDGPLGVFLSRQWHDLVAGVANVDATGDVNAGLHHHDPGSLGGWPHVDLDDAFFAEPAPKSDEIRVAGEHGINYLNGSGGDGTGVRQLVRAVALLFYLGNPQWEAGDGGETGLFTSAESFSAGPYYAVPPVNNSLVLFECTPFSWHSFMSNRTPRNSVVMWLHRTREDVIDRWGEHRVAKW